MRILVMGAGSMGSVVGGFMAQAGHDVVLVGRDPHMAAVRAGGLRISGIWGEHHVTTLDARTSAQELPPGQFDVILITTKCYDTAAAVAAVAPLADAGTLVCSYQNGLGNAELIAQAVGWQRTLGARVIFGTWIPEPGQVKVTVIAQPTAVGVWRPEAPAARAQAIAQAMDAAGVPTVFTDKIATVLWAKVAYNSALNPLSALLDVPYGVLAETEHTRAVMAEVVHELYAVARAMDVPLEPDTPEGYLELFYDVLLPPTSAHYASMREDFQQKRRTEIDALNGAVWRYGEAHGVACPANALLTRLVHGREHALGVGG